MVHMRNTELPAYKIVNAKNEVQRLQTAHDHALQELRLARSTHHLPTDMAHSTIAHLGPRDLQARIVPFDPPTEIPAPVTMQPDNLTYDPLCNRADRADRIRFDYHPVSNRPSQTFSSYEESLGTEGHGVDCEPPSKPYAPFPTLADFDLAEFVTKHRLSSSAIDDLLKRLHTTWANNVLVTMESAEEVELHIKLSTEPIVKV
ncbi:hypothetical protein FRC01_005203 [Tulasnella sp. 417]|nr:hypothetical protein FRC01_005203 [Tulasnella sp. 417]